MENEIDYLPNLVVKVQIKKNNVGTNFLYIEKKFVIHKFYFFIKDEILDKNNNSILKKKKIKKYFKFINKKLK